RSFGFNTNLQTESAFPRVGFDARLEAYPLIRQPRGWWRKIGLGVAYARESGRAAVHQSDGGEYSYPVSQSRWGFDLRYAIPVGVRAVVVPALGYGSSSFSLKRQMPVPPSMCMST